MNRIYKVIYILVFAIGYGNYRDANSVAVGAFCTRGGYGTLYAVLLLKRNEIKVFHIQCILEQNQN